MAKITLRPVHQMALFSALCLLMLWALTQPPSWQYNIWPSIIIPVLLIFGIWGSIVTLMMVSRERLATRAKGKRGLAARSTADMYTLIDRMIDNLSDEELDYLEQRLNDARSRLAEADWRESLDEVLEEREMNRRQRRG